MEYKEITVSGPDAGIRIDKILAKRLPSYSRSFLQKLLLDGQVTCEAKICKARDKAREGDILTVAVPEVREPEIEPEDILLSILYEDADVIVVDKPKGMVVHPAAGHYTHTLVNALLYHCKDSLSGIGGVMRPGIVHRIDMDTTGALLACKNDAAHKSIAQQLAVHSITRRYRAIVHGNLESDGTVEGSIGRHPKDRKKMAVGVPNGKAAVTHYRVLRQLRGFTYIECELETGRTHQIRVHMASIGHPILGDELYGPRRCPVKGLTGQTLHAMVIGFIHPTTQKYMEFEAPIPAYFLNLLKKLE